MFGFGRSQSELARIAKLVDTYSNARLVLRELAASYKAHGRPNLSKYVSGLADELGQAVLLTSSTDPNVRHWNKIVEECDGLHAAQTVGVLAHKLEGVAYYLTWWNALSARLANAQRQSTELENERQTQVADLKQYLQAAFIALGRPHARPVDFGRTADETSEAAANKIQEADRVLSAAMRAEKAIITNPEPHHLLNLDKTQDGFRRKARLYYSL